MFERLKDRAERVGADAAEHAKQRIAAELEAQDVRAIVAEQGVVLTGRRLSEGLWWIGGPFR